MDEIQWSMNIIKRKYLEIMSSRALREVEETRNFGFPGDKPGGHRGGWRDDIIRRSGGKCRNNCRKNFVLSQEVVFYVRSRGAIPRHLSIEPLSGRCERK